MKKLIAFSLTLLLILSFIVGCTPETKAPVSGDNANSGQSNDKVEEPTNKEYTLLSVYLFS